MAPAKNSSKSKKNTKKKTKRPASATATQIEQMQEQLPLSDGRKQLRAIIMFAVAVFLFCVAVIKSDDNNVWSWLHDTMFGLFGICAFIMPILLGVVAVLGALDKQYDKVNVRLVESGLFIWFICGAMDIFSDISKKLDFFDHITEAFSYEEVYGGALGTIIGHPLYKMFGGTGSKITIILLIIVMLMLLTGTTLSSAFSLIRRPFEGAGKALENQIEKKRNSERKPEPVLDIAAPGEDSTPTVEKAVEKSTTVAEKRRRVIAAYNGEDIPDETVDIPAEPEKEIAEIPTEEVEAEQLSVVPEPVAEEAPQETPENAEGKDKKEEIAPILPEGLSLSDIPEDNEAYRFPPLTLLQEGRGRGAAGAQDHEAVGEQLVNILRSFGIETKIINISVGPSITRYELQPAAGVKISKITSLSDDITMNLATAGVRIEAPIPNKPAVGIEVPNKKSNIVTIREIIDSKAFTNSKSKLTVALGKDIVGSAVVTDIAKMPHGLIAGATGSGKSVCINSIIMSILYNATPDEVKLLMIDPKVVELGVYNGIPHLLVPVVTDPRKAAGALGWAVTEMEKRYKMFADNDVRNLEGYNRLAEKSENLIKMPQILIIIDELADLMLTSSSEVQDSINRIAAKARAAGMHLLIATQRPSVDVITGTIKNNIPSRIAFAVSSATDSRTILDAGGAERLLGKGDMLFNPVGAIKPQRIQGCFVSDEEVESVVEFIKGVRTDEYNTDIMEEIERQAAATKDGKGSKGGSNSSSDEADPMLNAAIECVVENGQASTSHLQRRLKLGYARAARIMDEMAERGIIGPYEGAKPRAVLITKAQLMEMQARNDEITETEE